jgi:hypothetical protein
MERVRVAAAVRGRVRERADGVEHLDDRARPAVGHDQRQRVLMLGLDVHEVDVHAVDLRGELRQRVQPGFDPPSLVVCRPVVAQRIHCGQLHTLRAVADKLPARPARRRQAAPQILERLFGDLHGERLDDAASLLLESGHGRHCSSVGTGAENSQDPAGHASVLTSGQRICADAHKPATSSAARARETPVMRPGS